MTYFVFGIYCNVIFKKATRRPEVLGYRETIRFHGHNGPFLALGYKLGKSLVKKFKPKGIMGFKITVKTRLEKPFTCVIDGLQCSTFATFGKRNMSIKNSHSENIVIFVETQKRKYTYKITKKAMDICLTADSLDKAAQKIFKTPAVTLWRMM